MKLLTPVLIFFLAASLPAAHGQVESWYVEVSGGPSFSGDLAQEGFNLDPFCYPGHLCCVADQQGCSVTNPDRLPGYRWHYQIPTDPGFALRVGAGREQGRLRIDLNARYSTQNLEQVFSRITDLNGDPTPEFDPASGIIVNTAGAIGQLQVASLRINTFVDLLPQGHIFRPYLGIGTGVARATVTDVYFEERYSCMDQPCSPDLETYDSLQDEDLRDIVLLAAGHVGFEYVLTDKVLAGVRLTYSLLQNFSSEGEYIEHKLDDLGSTTILSRLNLITTMATVRYRL